MHNQIHLDLPPETQPLILNAKSYVSKSFSLLTSHSSLLSYLQSLSCKQFYTNIISTIFIQRFSFIHSFYSVNFPKDVSLPLLSHHLSEIYASLFSVEPVDASSQLCTYNELKLIFLITLFITNSAHNEYTTMIILTLRELKEQHYEQLITFLVEYVAKVPFVHTVKEELVNALMICEVERDVITKMKAIVDEQENERTKKKLKKTLTIERNKENKGVDKDNKAFKKVNFNLTTHSNDSNKQTEYTLSRGINSRLSAFTQRLQMCNVVVEKKERNDKRGNNSNNSNCNKTLSIIETFMEKCAELSKTKASLSSNNGVVGYKQSTKSKLRSIVNNNFYTNTNGNVGSKYLPRNVITNFDSNENDSLNNQYIILHNRKGRSHNNKANPSQRSHNKNRKHIIKRNSSDNDVVLAYKTPPKPKVCLPLHSSTSLNATTNNNAITVSIAKKNYYHLLNQQIK